MDLAPFPLLVCSHALFMSQTYSVFIKTKYRRLSSKFEKFYDQNEGFFKLNPMDSLRSLYQLFAIRYSLFVYSRIVKKCYSCKNSWMVKFANIRVFANILRVLVTILREEKDGEKGLEDQTNIRLRAFQERVNDQYS